MTAMAASSANARVCDGRRRIGASLARCPEAQPGWPGHIGPCPDSPTAGSGRPSATIGVCPHPHVPVLSLVPALATMRPCSPLRFGSGAPLGSRCLPWGWRWEGCRWRSPHAEPAYSLAGGSLAAEPWPGCWPGGAWSAPAWPPGLGDQQPVRAAAGDCRPGLVPGRVDNPGIGVALAFTAGLAPHAACRPWSAMRRWLPVRASAVPPGPGRRRDRLRRGGLVLGLLPALFFDPARAGCGQCPDDLLGVGGGDTEAFQALNRVGSGSGWPGRSADHARLLAAAAVDGRQTADDCAGARPGGRLPDPGRLGLPAWHRPGLSRQRRPRSPPLARAGGGALALALGVAWAWVRGRRTRSALATLVVDLRLPAPRRPGSGPRRTLDDPSLAAVPASPTAAGRRPRPSRPPGQGRR